MRELWCALFKKLCTLYTDVWSLMLSTPGKDSFIAEKCWGKHLMQTHCFKLLFDIGITYRITWLSQGMIQMLKCHHSTYSLDTQLSFNPHQLVGAQMIVWDIWGISATESKKASSCRAIAVRVHPPRKEPKVWSEDCLSRMDLFQAIHHLVWVILHLPFGYAAVWILK